MIGKSLLAVIALLAPAGVTANVPLPGTGVTVQEQASDPVRLASYGFGTKRTYLRGVTGDTFVRQKGFSEAALSPDGRRVAAVPDSYHSGWDSVVVTDRLVGKPARVRTVRKPLTASYASWSRDGTKVVLTVEKKVGGKWRTSGFTVVDALASTARTVTVTGAATGAGFWFAPDGNLVAEYGKGLRVYNPADGKVVRTFPSIGLPTGPEDAFSPSGRQLALWCPASVAEDLCVADPATGKIVRRVPVEPEALFGWWDESHVIAVAAWKGAYRLVVLDLTGKTKRVLAGVPAKAWKSGLWLHFVRER
ncbi:hypothetical protein ACIBEJ_29070 [Nonomuraea sp. NPDC050790]|uniref:hypothetical protein n=1 Tax=Nonomuraea sp. NPDC050790 TaxID=3364371 RepID=UPI0037A63D4A